MRDREGLGRGVIFRLGTDQQLLVDKGHLRSFHPNIIEPADRVPLSRIKVLITDPVEQDKASEEIKAKYAEYFGT